MKRNSILAVALLMLALVVGGGMGCSSSSSSSNNGGSVSFPTVDMAVGDRSFNNEDFHVFLWFDVLANLGPALPDPDVTLEPGNRSPTNAAFYNGDLYVAASENGPGTPTGGILIFRDYLTLTDGDTPDAVLHDPADPLLGPETIQRIALENNVLAGTTWYTTTGLYIWDNATTLTDGAAPDVFLDDTAMGLAVNFSNCMQDVWLSNGRLYVASCNTGTDVAVGIWDDVQDILDAGSALPPDITLTDFDNFIDQGYGMRTLGMDALGALYVGEYYGHTIYKFNDASAITSASLPDVIIHGCGDGSTSEVCDLDVPNAFTVVNDTLFVANNNQNFSSDFNAGVVGFPSASTLVNNQIPSIHLTRDVAIGQADRLATAGGALFISGVELDDSEYDYRAVHIYKDASSVFTSRASDLSILGDQNSAITFLEYPTGIAATVRGTFDNFVDNGT